MKLTRQQICALGLLGLLIFMFIPWLGLTPFNTKGEPREAIVAVSMLQSGNWILPVSFGADIPYKPPFLAWCIALFSLPAGHVSEFTARLPSALAVIGLCMTLFCTLRRRTAIGAPASAMAALVLATSIEVWRAGMACRVDMVLTFFIVSTILALYRWRERNYRGIPWIAVLCASAAVLTKGPAGTLLPCLVAGVYGLIRGDRFLPLLLRLAAVCLTSLIIPACWYLAAWQQGGDNFLSLVLEENIGRFTGTMSYSSHEKPIWYNFATVALGMLPYTLLGLIGLFCARRPGRQLLPRFWRWLRSADAFTVMTVVATLVIFIFYCIPKSKRSVYLLPIYPFLAYYVVLLIHFMIARRGNLVRAYSAVISAAAILVGAAGLILPWTWHLLPNLASPAAAGWIAALAAFVGGTYLSWILWMRTTIWCERTAIVVTALTLTAVTASLLPSALTAKSDRDTAALVNAAVPAGEPVYSFVTEPMMRFFTINFYSRDRLLLYEKELPSEGYMIIGEKDIDEWQRRYGGIYHLEPVATSSHRSCDNRQIVKLIHFRPE